MKHRFNFLTLLLVLFTIPAGIFKPEKTNSQSEAADHCFGICTNTISGMEHQCLKMFGKNIDWLAEEFLPYGYDMAATFNLNSMNQYGYLTKYLTVLVDIRTEVLRAIISKE